MTTATTAYRDYVLERFADSLYGNAFDDFGGPQQKSAVRPLYGKVVAFPTTIQRDFVIQDDAEPRGLDRLPLILKEPESELQIFVRSQPIEVRRVKVRIVSRTIGVPNPILPDLGE